MRSNSFLLALFFFCLGIATLASAVTKADAIGSLKKMNTDACVQIGSNVPDAPKNPKLIAPYCGCVSDAYWMAVPVSEQEELLTKGNSPGIAKNLDSRMAAAQVACRKKLAF